jgi:hypothetical protein
VGGSSYEKVIVAVLACHGEGRVWERATAAGGTRGTGGSGRESWRVEAVVVYRQTTSLQGRQSRVMRVVAEGRCVCVSLLSWAKVTGCRSLVNKERQRKRRRRRGVCVCTSWNCMGTDSSLQGSGRRRQGSTWSSPESPARPQTTQPQPQLRQVSALVTQTVANVHIDQPLLFS